MSDYLLRILLIICSVLAVVNVTDMGDVLAEDGEALIDIGIIGDIGRNVTVIVYTVDRTAKGRRSFIITIEAH